MAKWIYTGKVYNISEFGILDLQLACSPVGRISQARLGQGGDCEGPWLDIVRHPDDESGNLWAEVQQKELGG